MKSKTKLEEGVSKSKSYHSCVSISSAYIPNLDVVTAVAPEFNITIYIQILTTY